MTDPARACRWIDLVDPTPDAIADAWAGSLDAELTELLCAPARADDLPRPGFRSRRDVVAAVFLLPVLTDDATAVVHQEIDVLLDVGSVLTVRKTPLDRDGRPTGLGPYDVSDVAAMVERGEALRPGQVACAIADDVAEAFLDLIDGLVDRIDELEDQVESGDRRSVHQSISKYRHDLLHLRRIVTPTRDAARRVVDGRVEIGTGDLFPRELELAFADVYDKLLRAGDSLETARELLGGVRDYVQAEIANDQNEVMKRLTAAASILLVPTFIVGLYGQNFTDIPELKWSFGYVYSWTLIIVITALQVWWFRRKKWI